MTNKHDQKIAILGIDASYRSTGICIQYKNDQGETKDHLYRLFPREDKSKMSAHVRALVYDKIYTETKDFDNDDLGKIENCKRILKRITTLMAQYEKDYGIQAWDIRFEGNVMNAFAKGQMLRIVDMVGLQSILKAFLCKKNTITSVYAISSLKKQFCGRGQAKRAKDPTTGKSKAIEDSKMMMVNHFLTLFPKFDTTGKIDDVVDAYALANVECNHKATKYKKLYDYLESLS